MQRPSADHALYLAGRSHPTKDASTTMLSPVVTGQAGVDVTH
jgi:hypothetical protein